MVANNDYLTKTKDYYDDRLGNENNSSELNMVDWFRWEAIEKKIKKRVNSISKEKLTILDYGCGTGWLSNLLSQYGDVTGIDISEKAIELASQKYKQVNFLAFDASSNAYEKIKKLEFDIVVSSEVIEHIQDQKNYFDNMMKLLKPNGLLILTTPNGQWKDNYFYKDRSDWGQPFEFWLKPAELENIAKPYLNSISVVSFHSNGLLHLKSFGVFNLLGNRFVLKGIKILKLHHMYYKMLDRFGYGLYLILTGFKNGI